MSPRSSSPPKRRASNPAADNPPKVSKMSAAAPEFKPRVVSEDDAMNGTTAGTSGSAPLSAEVRSQLTAAVNHARVTRPLPNSRQTAPAANFVPQAASAPKTNMEKENKRRLIVVLSQVG